MSEVTFCIYCMHRFAVTDKTPNYVMCSTQFIDYCSATKNKVLCKDRNKKGSCKYYKWVGRSFPI